MSNMTYCRFHNTVTDLEDCRDALVGIYGNLESLSRREQSAAKELIEICREIAERFWGGKNDTSSIRASSE